MNSRPTVYEGNAIAKSRPKASKPGKRPETAEAAFPELSEKAPITQVAIRGEVQQLDAALSRALDIAASKGDLEAIKAIVRELEARRLAGSNVERIDSRRVRHK